MGDVAQKRGQDRKDEADADGIEDGNKDDDERLLMADSDERKRAAAPRADGCSQWGLIDVRRDDFRETLATHARNGMGAYA